MSFEIRKAALSDVGAIAALVNSYAARGIMLARTESELAGSVRDFTVACDGARLLGAGALRIYTAEAAEVRSLAVEPDRHRRGVGRALVEALEVEARQFGLAELFAFTYVPDFFGKLGFQTVERGQIPLKAWKDCLRCSKFKACDEIAVQKVLDPARAAISRIRGYTIPTIIPRSLKASVPFIIR